MPKKTLDLGEALALIPKSDQDDFFEFLAMTGLEGQNPESLRDALDASLAMKEILAAGSRN